MDNKPSLNFILFLVIAVLCILSIGLLGLTTLKNIQLTEEQVATTAENIKKEKEILADLKEQLQERAKLQAGADTLSSLSKTKEESQGNPSQEPAQETAEDTGELSEGDSQNKASVFDQASEAVTESKGKIIGIDPGHQGSWVDMSATEPDGPGSSNMKAKSSTGTQGTYTGLNEYELNLDVSLKLKEILEERGYQVVMTRTDNATAISNAERAQMVAENGADIYVRIHANGDDSHTVSGALTMCPTQNNPYVSALYEESNRLSQCILDAYCAATGFSNKGIQYVDNMTGINWSEVPVTILEMGFMTYESDDLQMADSEFQNTMAQGIADGIDAYFGY